MTLILVGFNHQTAPVELRERFYLSDSACLTALASLKGDTLPEVAVLSTCNRLEILACAEQTEAGFEAIESFLATLQNTAIQPLHPYLYFLEGQKAVQHLMRVTCGLESLILGETQILGQAAHALALAQSAGSDGTMLSRLFDAALHAGKRARSETAISQHSLSVSHVAALLVKNQMGDLTDVRILIIGAGEMAELAAKALGMHGATSMSVINRTRSKASEFAQRRGVQMLEWGALREVLLEFDVVIAATSAPDPIIRFEDVTTRHDHHPVLFVDIGVPRNIEEKVGTLPGCRLYDIDDLSLVVDEHLARRQAEVTGVETIIAEEIERYSEWLHNRDVVPVIAELRRQAEALAQAEVQQTLRRLPELDRHEQEVVTQMAHRIVNKMLHIPTMTLKSRPNQGEDSNYVHAVRQLFVLDEREIGEHSQHE